MVIQQVLLAHEAYTHDGWGYRDVCVGYSRIYYILGGEAYYEEDGVRIPLKAHHLYITPVHRPFSLSENPEDKLNHTYAHIITTPPVDTLTELAVAEGTPLADAVALWRKYTPTGDMELLRHVLEFLLCCLPHPPSDTAGAIAERIKGYLDRSEIQNIRMSEISRALGYSREYLTRAFLTAYRTTPRQYLHARRMQTAREQLLAGASVQEVAADIGYASAYAFSKAFKKHFGLPPGSYRRHKE